MTDKEKNNSLSIQADRNSQLYVTNRLFSRHYIQTRVNPSDYCPSEKQISDIYNECKRIYTENIEALWFDSDEQQTRDELINPLLTALGYSFLTSHKSPGPSQQNPDYLLFDNEETKSQARTTEKKSRSSLALTFLEAKDFQLDLDKKKGTRGTYPYQQVQEYLQNERDEQLHPYFDWAILTNGRTWRLYTRESFSESYYEMSLGRALENLDNFKLFYTFFNPVAFRKDTEGSCRLDYLKRQALARQAELEESLQQRVYTIVEILANGIYHHPRNKIDKDQLDKLYDHCLILLYRLLFILYAESRSLLPVNKKRSKANIYLRDYSLQRFVSQLVNDDFNAAEEPFNKTQSELNDLFHLINGTYPERNQSLGLPLYNGGLFDPQKHPRFESWSIGDYTFKRVLIGLLFKEMPTPVEETISIKDRDTIDYSDLEVRQLGSIYEGLLEHRLQENSRDRLILNKDTGERKSSGSFYTPDYVVQYIVQQTIGKQLDRIEQLPVVQQALNNELRDNSFANEVLKLKVLDPSMGSGHFLVRATEYIAEKINEHETTKPIDISSFHKESDNKETVFYWKRRVIESCIYGVDLNPLAVELAKLSLWLICVSRDRPLSFLDHHLRCGNSLVGAPVSEINRLRSKKGVTNSLFSIENLREEISQAVSSLDKIRRRESVKLADIRAKETIFEKEVQRRLVHFRAIADLHTSFNLGCKFTEDEYIEISSELLHLKKEKPSAKVYKRYSEILQRQASMKEKHRFFHWELEFPDVFADDEEQGFDVVLGNPPYVRIQTLQKSNEVDYYKTNFHFAHKGNFDLYILFIEKGLGLVKTSGMLGLITPSKFFSTDYAICMRDELSRNNMLDQIVDFGHNIIFKGVSTYTCLIFLSKISNTKLNYIKVTDINRFKENQLDTIVIDTNYINASPWTFSTNKEQKIIVKINKHSKPLLSLPTSISRGSSTGNDGVFIVKQFDDAYKTSNGELIKLEPHLLRIPIYATDFHRYSFHLTHSNRVIFPYKKDQNHYRLIEEEELREIYPNTYTYLKSQKERLIERKQYTKWYSFSAPRNLDLHDKADMMVSLLANKGNFCTLPQNGQKFCLMASGGFSIKIESEQKYPQEYVLALLNSKLLFWRLRSISNIFRGGWITCTKQYVGTLPIKIPAQENDELMEITNTIVKTAKLIEKRLADSFGSSLNHDKIEHQINTLDNQLDQLVYQLYGLNDDEIELIEQSFRQ